MESAPFRQASQVMTTSMRKWAHVAPVGHQLQFVKSVQARSMSDLNAKERQKRREGRVHRSMGEVTAE
eukprot:6485004-Amphidinium_carterae.1